MKIKSSLKSIKKRDQNSKWLREEVEFILLIKLIQNLKQDKNSFMDDNDHNKTWNNFTKFVLWNCRCSCYFSSNGNFLIIVSFYENWFSKKKQRN